MHIYIHGKCMFTCTPNSLCGVLLYIQMKKHLTKMDKIRLKGWRTTSHHIMIGNTKKRNSQIGQLLFYQTVMQLQRIQLYLKPTGRDEGILPPTKGLGLYSEKGRVYVKCI